MRKKERIEDLILKSLDILEKELDGEDEYKKLKTAIDILSSLIISVYCDDEKWHDVIE